MKLECRRVSRLIDELDRKIIRVLLKDARISYREIAKELDVAVGTIYNRVKRLEEEGVVEGFLPKLNYEKLGYDLTVIIGIKAQGKRIRDIESEIAGDEHVMCVYDVTGEYDIIVIAKFRNREDMNRFVKRVLSIDGVEKTNTHVALEVVKEDFRLEP
jgi:DNA-binding Lrp family transcriptional regulator